MKAEQVVLDFDATSDTVILIAIDGREVEVSGRDLVVSVGPDRRARGRHVLPESVLQPPPVCATPPPGHKVVATVGRGSTRR